MDLNSILYTYEFLTADLITIASQFNAAWGTPAVQYINHANLIFALCHNPLGRVELLLGLLSSDEIFTFWRDYHSSIPNAFIEQHILHNGVSFLNGHLSNLAMQRLIIEIGPAAPDLIMMLFDNNNIIIPLNAHLANQELGLGLLVSALIVQILATLSVGIAINLAPHFNGPILV